jgi:hypothetical protein
MMLSIKTILLGLLVSLFALAVNANPELRRGELNEVRELVEHGEGQGIHDLVQKALDFARMVVELCTTDGVRDNEAVAFFCDRVF